jgi:hypothetical protein
MNSVFLLEEMFINICKFVSLYDLITLIKVCKKFHQWLIKSKIWENFKYMNFYNVFKSIETYQNKDALNTLFIRVANLEITPEINDSSYKKMLYRFKMENKTVFTLKQIYDEKHLTNKCYINNEVINMWNKLILNNKFMTNFVNFIKNRTKIGCDVYDFLLSELDINHKNIDKIVDTISKLMTLYDNNQFIIEFDEGKNFILQIYKLLLHCEFIEQMRVHKVHEIVFHLHTIVNSNKKQVLNKILNNIYIIPYAYNLNIKIGSSLIQFNSHCAHINGCRKQYNEFRDIIKLLAIKNELDSELLTTLFNYICKGINN